MKQGGQVTIRRGVRHERRLFRIHVGGERASKLRFVEEEEPVLRGKIGGTAAPRGSPQMGCLRKKLKADDGELIRTERGAGYILAANVEIVR